MHHFLVKFSQVSSHQAVERRARVRRELVPEHSPKHQQPNDKGLFTPHELNSVNSRNGDSDVISMPAGFRRHLVDKTVINVFHCDITEIRQLVIIQTFS